MMNFSVPSRGLLALTVMVASAAAQADQTVAKRGAPRVEVEFVEYQNDGQVIALGARGQKRISGGNETLSANQEGRGKGQVAGGKGQNMAGVGPGDLLDPYGNAGDFGMGPSPSPNPKDLYPNAPGTTGMGGYGGYGMGYGGYGYDPYMMGGGYGMGYGGYGMMGYGMMRPCIMVGPDGQQITDRICQAERIVNLGKRVFDWIREGTATYNERQDYATAVPESVESWEDLEEWAEEPLQTIQGLRYSAYLSDRIVRAEIKWAVQCSWGGAQKRRNRALCLDDGSTYPNRCRLGG